mmetsp:Transcript_12597/g.19080  ORF Transcript_12597/g.19080 Transcript_12597/m.19080 type:complete len:325 (-) Transcript_12597:57-1031(-)|eukprot:CAMPEP_0203680034 /NCGR_PEP_ID=MMETSP0090-20130426/37805_1 /ASSEMBLY_ACC=CAM_ASM_001088 /TAXON_ID=426623 /ORGANISM="Chaetoceros affinis, Strain CCMP159" /LENGTH=324 /DNA_ID=CAMNT_0050547919 /DNA_START=65 /DNA_END=1039 /DNA_ORIENTATION=+
MNINLKESVKRKKQRNRSKKPQIQFGLNPRSERSLVTGGRSSSTDEEADNEKPYDVFPSSRASSSSRNAVNRELAKEQAALRLRGEKAMKDMSTKSGDIYDYDGDFESFSSGYQQQIYNDSQREREVEGVKESKYIANLLKKAKERKQEKEIIMERKIARDQQAEGAKDEYLGKDKFVTRGYKRVLEERKVWIENDKKQTKIEEEEDVTKRKGAGLMGFYGNFSQNVALGGRESEKSCTTKKTEDSHDFSGNITKAKPTHSEYSRRSSISSATSKYKAKGDNDTQSLDGLEIELQEQALKAKRMQKIFEARDRYLLRRKLCTSQ